MAQQEFLSKYPEDALSIVHDASASLCLSASQKWPDSQKPLLHRILIPVLRELLVRHPESMIERCLHQLKENYSATIDAIQQTLTLLLQLPGSLFAFYPLFVFVSPSNYVSQCSDGSLAEAEGAINKVDDFSLPFCQLKLQLLFDTASQEDVKDGIIDMMFKAAVSDVRAGKSHWLDLVSLANQDAVQQVCC
jgi:mediator of RNA polymerase II transcription subunit 12